jgi:ribosome-binding protein aMBF1 (putative translation factor)
MKSIVFTAAAAQTFDTPQARAAVGGEVRALRGREGSRMRAGGYRVLFEEDVTTILVLHVGRRRTASYFAEASLMPQKIVTPNGEEMLVLSRAEYDRLSALAAMAEEDAADVAAYDAAKADLAAGRDERLPEEVSALLLHGASLVAAIRKWRGMRQTELAERARVSQGYLSDLESGRRKGAKETLEALAKALDVPAGWLG